MRTTKEELDSAIREIFGFNSKMEYLDWTNEERLVAFRVACFLAFVNEIDNEYSRILKKFYKEWEENKLEFWF